MSWEAVTWAVAIGEERALDPVKRHILLILANRADEAGYCYPSITWISKRTGYDRRTVQRQCKSMEKEGLLGRVPRSGATGDRTSDAWQLAMQQPGLPLGGQPVDKTVDNSHTPPRHSAAPPRQAAATPAAQRRHPRGTAPPYSKDLSKEDTTTRRGGGSPPSPVAQAFKAYQDGIRTRYRAEYPPSAKANGQLANVVGRVGKDRVLDVVRHYLAHADPFYARTKHSLDYLVRDCEKFALEVGASQGEGPAPTTAEVGIELPDGKRQKVEDYPAGDPRALAIRCLRQFANWGPMRSAKNIYVRQGREQRVYAIEEL